LKQARETMPDPIDYQDKLARFKDALAALSDPDVDAQAKNRLLKACIKRIEYNREKPQRLQGQRKNVTINGKRRSVSPLPTGGNWSSPPIELNVKLNI